MTQGGARLHQDAYGNPAVKAEEKILDLAGGVVVEVVSEELNKGSGDRVFTTKAIVNGVTETIKLIFSGIVDKGNTSPNIVLEGDDLGKVSTNSILLQTFLNIKPIIYLGTDNSNDQLRGSWVRN